MDFEMVCGTWIKDADEKILDILKASDKWLSAEELSVLTGLPLHRVQRTLHLLKQQKNFYEFRKNYLSE